MPDIETIRSHFDSDSVYVTQHASQRYRERGIGAKDIRNAVFTGEIIEHYPDDHPSPSCLVMGVAIDGRQLHVCLGQGVDSSHIITAYFPSSEKWEADGKTRKERRQ